MMKTQVSMARVFRASEDPKKAAQRLLGFAHNDMCRVIAGDNSVAWRVLKTIEDALLVLDRPWDEFKEKED